MNAIFLILSFFFALFASLRLCAFLGRSCGKTQRHKERKGNQNFGRRLPLDLARVAMALSFFAFVGGCATVKPWQREALADPIMQPDRNPMQTALLDHVYFSREAASGGRSVGGGGCGCN